MSCNVFHYFNQQPFLPDAGCYKTNNPVQSYFYLERFEQFYLHLLPQFEYSVNIEMSSGYG